MSKEREEFIKALGIKPDGKKAKVIRELPEPFWKELRATVNPKKDILVRISLTSVVVQHDIGIGHSFLLSRLKSLKI